MLDQQWELVYPGVDLVLGRDPSIQPYLQRGYHHMKAPDIGDVTLTTDDSDRPRSDGIAFGQDYRGGRLITFELGLRGNDNGDVLALATDLLRAWRGDGVRNTPGGVATLSTSNLGRLRTCYGRPRRASASHTAPRSAFMFSTVDFQTADDLFYDPTASMVTLGLVPPPSGGIVFPTSFPMSVVGTGSSYGSVPVGGEAATWPIVQFNGPVTNPSCELVNQWTLALNMTVVSGAYVRIDCRPWARTIQSANGGSYAGYLARGSRLDKAFLSTGTSNTVAFHGVDATGTSSMNFSWYNAYVSI